MQKGTLELKPVMVPACVLFVNPFDFDRDILSNEVHSGPLYLASYLKARLGENTIIHFLDLKIEVEKKTSVPLPYHGKWREFLTAIESIIARKLAGFSGQVIFAISCLTSACQAHRGQPPHMPVRSS